MPEDFDRRSDSPPSTQKWALSRPAMSKHATSVCGIICEAINYRYWAFGSPGQTFLLLNIAFGLDIKILNAGHLILKRWAMAISFHGFLSAEKAEAMSLASTHVSWGTNRCCVRLVIVSQSLEAQYLQPCRLLTVLSLVGLAKALQHDVIPFSIKTF